MTTTATQDTQSRVYLQLGDAREDAVKAVLTRRVTIAEALKTLSAINSRDVARHAEALLETKIVKGLMFLSPGGSLVYVMAPRTRVIDGVKRSVMTIVQTVAVRDVLAFEVK